MMQENTIHHHPTPMTLETIADKAQKETIGNACSNLYAAAIGAYYALKSAVGLPTPLHETIYNGIMQDYEEGSQTNLQAILEAPLSPSKKKKAIVTALTAIAKNALAPCSGSTHEEGRTTFAATIINNQYQYSSAEMVNKCAKAQAFMEKSVALYEAQTGNTLWDTMSQLY
jgi:hypothetical protein